MAKKCILFLRVSTEQQDLEQQKLTVIDEAIRHGYKENDHIIVEVKESGVKLDIEHRRGIQQMKSIIETEDVGCVFIYELSRLSRRPADLYSIRDYLIAKNVNLISMKPAMVMLNEDGTLNNMASIIFGLFSSLAEQEGYIRKERMARGREYKKSNGCFTGGTKLFGYTTVRTQDGHKYVADEHDAKIVQRLFERYANEQVSFRSLARELQSSGEFTEVKYLTLVQKLNSMIRNKKYLGDAQHPQIISQYLFDKANSKCTDNIINPKRGENTQTALLKGKLYDKNNTFLLSCNTATQCYYSKRFHGVAVKYNTIDPVIWEYVVDEHRKHNSSIDIQTTIIRNIQLLTRKIHTSKDNIYKYEQQIEKVEERLIMGKITDSKAEQLETNINYNILEERRKIREYSDELDRQHEMNKPHQELDYDKMTLSDRIDIVHQVIDKIILERKVKNILTCEIVNKYDKETYIIEIKRSIPKKVAN